MAFPSRSGMAESFDFLFRHAVLQSHGVDRRNAIDTLRSSHTHHWAVPAFCGLLRSRDAPIWLQSRAAFALGMCGVANDEVGDVLTAAVERLIGEGESGAEPAEAAHTILFAIGDCFGGSRRRSKKPPQRLTAVIGAIVRAYLSQPEQREALQWPLRAAAYCTAMVFPVGSEDHVSLVPRFDEVAASDHLAFSMARYDRRRPVVDVRDPVETGWRERP